MGFLILTWLAFSIIVGVAANARGRSGFGWFLIALILSPILALILVLVMKPAVSPEAVKSIGASPNSKTEVDFLYNDTPDLEQGKYQLFLTNKYAIERNATLEKYVIGDELFSTLDAALRHADSVERSAIEKAAKERSKYLYLVKECSQEGTAFACGVRPGDRLVSYNNHPIITISDLSTAISGLKNPTADLVIYRDGKEIKLTINEGKMGITGGFGENIS